jgi:hypothetical protein
MELALGIVASVIANVNRDPRTTDAYKPSDFMQDWGAGYREAVDAEQHAIVVAHKLDMLFGAMVIRQQKDQGV